MKKTIAVILMIVLLAGVLPVAPAAAAEVEGKADADKAISVVTNAITDLKDVMPQDPTYEVLTTIFEGIKSAGSTVASFVGPVNATVSFLKLIGVMHDSTSTALANIMNQLRSINDKLAEMDAKLNNITETLVAIQAHGEFNDRTEQAILMRKGWKDFKTVYMEDNMDRLISEYRGMLLNGMQKWCQNRTSDARFEGDVDNTKLILFYLPTEDGYEIAYTAENGIPADFPEDGRYLVIPEKFLPESLAWNVNSYRANLESYIAEQIKKAASSADFESFECRNYPEYTMEGDLTIDLVEQTAKDAVDLLSYRIAASGVNEDALFSLEVSRLFENYCTHLFQEEEGIDAILKSYYLTHAFEYQVVDDINRFCNEMALTTGTYGAFVLNVLGMSNYITDGDKDSAENLFYKTLIKIDKAKNDALTGDQHYCYVTNSCVWLTGLLFYSSGSITVKKDGATDDYVGYSGDGTTAHHTDLGNGRDASPAEMIGDSNALLLSYLLRSNGEPTDTASLSKKIGTSVLGNDYPYVTSFKTMQSMPISGHFPLLAQNVIGSYFKHGSTVYLNDLPDDAESEYFRYAKMIKGAVCDLSTSTYTTDKVLHAFALYGESHWYWFTDEAAILGGPTTQCVFQYLKYPVTSKIVTTPDGPVIYYYHTYSQQTQYNALLSLPYTPDFSEGDDYNPLVSYRDMCEELWPDDPEIRSGSFEDVSEDDWFSDAVEWAAENRITNGIDDTHFGPFETATRAQMVTFLWRAAGRPDPAGTEMQFGDVDENAYYYKALLWAVEKGIIKGVTETRFDPNGTVDRAQTVTMLWRYVNGTASGDNPFKDVKEDDYYYDAVRWAAENGVTKGTSGTTFSPHDDCIRAQVVSFLYNVTGIWPLQE